MKRWLVPIPLAIISMLTLAACSSLPVVEEPQSRATPVPAGSAAQATLRMGTRDADALIEYVADNSAHLTRLAPDYLYERLQSRDDNPKIAAAFDLLLLGAMPAAHQDLIHALELDFIHNPDTSSLDLLNPELSAHFREFDWQEQDYPGGPEGPNEKLADMITDALDLITPERRANRSRTAILVRSIMTDEIWSYVLSQWAPVPGEPDWKLNRHAVLSYVRMREAAAADGVELRILSGHRDPLRARQNAERVGNAFAVASFSSHSLGLAIDFALPKAGSDERFRLTTSPMQEVVEMRRSPTHKWLHLHAREHGWYPFQHEPWHWEFNPPGFRQIFFADFPGGPPALE